MQKATKNDVLLLAVICATLIFSGISLLFFPTPRFSAAENRLLAERPAFSWQTLWQGDYTAAWETYAAERLTVRELLRRTHAVCEIALGKKECGAVMLCRDGSLAARPQANDSSRKKNINGIAATEKACRIADLPFTVTLVPYRAEARAEVAPSSYHSEMTKYLVTALKEKETPCITLNTVVGDEAWFRTDHHWTAEGAYAAYRCLGDVLGYTPYEKEDFQPITVTQRFYGTAARASGIPLIHPDSITLWRYSNDEAYRLCKDGKTADFKGFYDFSKLTANDGYAVFLGGNDGLLTVEQEDADTRPTLLLWRDSYAAALIPFLARHYRITAVDPRYYRGDTASLLTGADRALLIAGAVTLTESAFLTGRA